MVFKWPQCCPFCDVMNMHNASYQCIMLSFLLGYEWKREQSLLFGPCNRVIQQWQGLSRMDCLLSHRTGNSISCHLSPICLFICTCLPKIFCTNCPLFGILVNRSNLKIGIVKNMIFFGHFGILTNVALAHACLS